MEVQRKSHPTVEVARFGPKVPDQLSSLGEELPVTMKKLRGYSVLGLLRGAIVDRTYGAHKNLCIYFFLPTMFGPIYYGPP